MAETMSDPSEAKVSRHSPAVVLPRIDPQYLLGIRELSPAESTSLVAKNGGSTIFVDLSQAAPLEIFIELRFRSPDNNKTFKARGVVRWLNQGVLANQPSGVGIQVLDVVPERSDSGIIQAAPSGKPGQADAGQGAQPAVGAATSGSRPAAEAGKAGSGAASGGGSGAHAAQPAVAGEPVKLEVPLPTRAAIGELMSSLVGKEVTTSEQPPWNDSLKQAAFVGTYVDNKDTVKALVLGDLSLACFVGSALSMVPAEEAQTVVKSGKISDSMAENCREIINVAASLFNSGSATHLKLKTAHFDMAALPDDVKAWVAKPPARMDLQANVPDYGPGRMSVMVLA